MSNFCTYLTVLVNYHNLEALQAAGVSGDLESSRELDTILHRDIQRDPGVHEAGLSRGANRDVLDGGQTSACSRGVLDLGADGDLFVHVSIIPRTRISVHS